DPREDRRRSCDLGGVHRTEEPTGADDRAHAGEQQAELADIFFETGVQCDIGFTRHLGRCCHSGYLSVRSGQRVLAAGIAERQTWLTSLRRQASDITLSNP